MRCKFRKGKGPFFSQGGSQERQGRRSGGGRQIGGGQVLRLQVLWEGVSPSSSLESIHDTSAHG